MVAALFLPVVVFLAVALQLLRNGEQEAALHGLQETARASALIVDRELGSFMAALKMLATTSYLETGDLEGFYKLAKPLSRDHRSWTVLIDENGQQLVNTLLPFSETLLNGGNPDIGRQVMAMQKPPVSNLQVGSVSKKQSAALFFSRAGARRQTLM